MGTAAPTGMVVKTTLLQCTSGSGDPEIKSFNTEKKNLEAFLAFSQKRTFMVSSGFLSVYIFINPLILYISFNGFIALIISSSF